MIAFSVILIIIIFCPTVVIVIQQMIIDDLKSTRKIKRLLTVRRKGSKEVLAYCLNRFAAAEVVNKIAEKSREETGTVLVSDDFKFEWVDLIHPTGK